jgi:carboxybiotin decarboxylase
LSRRGELPEKIKRKSSFFFAPISRDCIFVNIPLSSVRLKDGFMRIISDAGSSTELFPLLIFVGSGASTDFGPVPAKPGSVEP